GTAGPIRAAGVYFWRRSRVRRTSLPTPFRRGARICAASRPPGSGSETSICSTMRAATSPTACGTRVSVSLSAPYRALPMVLNPGRSIRDSPRISSRQRKHGCGLLCNEIEQEMTTRNSMKENTMKRIQFHRYGGPEEMRLEDGQLPALRDDEILVRVKAASI